MPFPRPTAWKRYRETITVDIDTVNSFTELGVPIATTKQEKIYGVITFPTQKSNLDNAGIYSQTQVVLYTETQLAISTTLIYKNIKYKIMNRSIHNGFYMYNINESVWVLILVI